MVGTLKVVLLSMLGLFVLAIVHTLHIAYRGGIRRVPGPWQAKFSILYRLSLVTKGKAPEEYGKLHDKYGEIVRVGPNQVSINDPATVSQIYGISSHFGKSEFYSVSPPYYQGKQLENMFTTRNLREHRELRSATASVYSMTNLKNYEPHVDECTEIFLRILERCRGQSIDITDYMHFYALDVIAAITFQNRLGYLDHQQDVLGLVASRGFSAKYFGIVGQIPWLHPYLLGNRRMVKWLAKMYPSMPDPHGTLFAVIEKQIDHYDLDERLNDRMDFLQQLRLKDDPDRPHHRRDLVNHLSNNVTAGGDTIAVALRAMLYFLSKTPHSYEALVDEICEADRENKLSPLITYEESLNLKYLQAVMKEAMRLHPSICFPLERVVPAGGANVSGHDLPGGTIVGILAPLVNRDKQVFGQDAESFRPERWLEADPERLKLMERTFLTFGHGSRGCIGKNIAMLEMSKILPEIVRRFDFEWVGGEDKTWTTTAGWFWKQKCIELVFISRANVMSEKTTQA